MSLSSSGPQNTQQIFNTQSSGPMSLQQPTQGGQDDLMRFYNQLQSIFNGGQPQGGQPQQSTSGQPQQNYQTYNFTNGQRQQSQPNNLYGLSGGASFGAGGMSGRLNLNLGQMLQQLLGTNMSTIGQTAAAIPGISSSLMGMMTG